MSNITIERIKQTIESSLENIPNMCIRNKTLREAPFSTLTEADLQALIYNDLIRRQVFKFVDASDEYTHLVHAEYPPKGMKKYLKNGKIRKREYRSCHDLVVIDHRAITSDLFDEHYNIFPIRACIELKHRWCVPVGNVRKAFKETIVSILDTMSYDDSLEAGYVAIYNANGRLDKKDISDLKKEFGKYAEKNIFCIYLDIRTDDNPTKVVWLDE